MADTVGAVLIVLAAFLAGSVPSSNLAARRFAGVDLRTVGTGTVSGTGLYRVAGFGPLALAGVLDIAKGAVGPALASGRPLLQAMCCGLAVAGHNWSPFLRGAGGRGISPALGALVVTAWPAAVTLAAGLVAGRLLSESGLGTFVGLGALVPVASLTHGRFGAVAGSGVVAAMLVKRVVGNARPHDPSARTYLTRLLYDHDPEPGAG